MQTAQLSDKPAKHAARCACACLLAFFAAAAAAQESDPLKSAACAQALGNLESARSAGGAPTVVEGLRAAAAATCLGSSAIPQRPGRVAQPPVSVPPQQVDLPVRVAPLPPAALPPPPVPIDRAPSPALCDASGCWASDGTHLRRVGPNLAGPGGPCVQQGALIACP